MVQKIKYVVVGVLLFSTLVLLPYYYRLNTLNKDRFEQVTQYALISRDSAIIYRNKYEQAVVQVRIARLDRAAMAALREDLKNEITDRFNGVNKRLNNVEAMSKVTLTAIASLKTIATDTVILRDSIALTAWKFSAYDPYFRVDGLVYPTTKEVIVNPFFTANVYAINYWKRPHKFLGIRFGKKQYKAEITSDNPYVNFSDYKVIIRKWE
jgi:hypothetical protein